MLFGPVMLDLESTVLTPDEEELLQHPLVGGVIFFARNYESLAQISALTAAIRHIRPQILIAVDQEGGRVQRFKDGFTRLPAMQQFLPLYRKNPKSALSLVKDSGWLMASELLAIGVDFSFAPVLDLDDCSSPVIADRSFSDQPTETVALASAWMEGMHEAGMATTGKHFPGHGSVTVDSHLSLPLDSRDWGSIQKHDLVPFEKLQLSLDAIMPAHILFPEIDPSQPVGFSSHWLKTVLRKELKFEGVIFSDDLTMEGAASAGSFIQRANLALEAGCDMVLICNNREGALEVLEKLVVDDRLESDARLRSMAARKTVNDQQIKSTSRWKLSHQLLGTFA
ncbi:MAG: beta-N-acetylhexosaminidase [Cellvibrionaceae bacterium]